MYFIQTHRIASYIGDIVGCILSFQDSTYSRIWRWIWLIGWLYPYSEVLSSTFMFFSSDNVLRCVPKKGSSAVYPESVPTLHQTTVVSQSWFLAAVLRAHMLCLWKLTLCVLNSLPPCLPELFAVCQTCRYVLAWIFWTNLNLLWLTVDSQFIISWKSSQPFLHGACWIFPNAGDHAIFKSLTGLQILTYPRSQRPTVRPWLKRNMRPAKTKTGCH